MPDPDHALIITCEHATNHIPRRYALLFGDLTMPLMDHSAFDNGAAELARLLAARFAAPCFEADVSRLLVDCNRSPGHRGLFCPRLEADERDALFNRHYLPFRQSALAAIEAAVSSGRRVLHLSIHSFTPCLNGEVRRADLGFLYDPRRQGEKAFCRRWLATLKEMQPSLRLRRNYPYRGVADGFTTAVRKILPPESYLGIELEVNQRLVDEAPPVWAQLRQTIAASLAAAVAGER
ncbi:MAG: N-formylglutamate amidohydrolase [Desulfobulbaceae bacterium]|nr:N-formylglutamate amidohydrolase [Desulfobulbaceae bacterium]